MNWSDLRKTDNKPNFFFHDSVIQAVGDYLKYLDVLRDSSGMLKFLEPNKVLIAQQTNSVMLEDV